MKWQSTILHPEEGHFRNVLEMKQMRESVGMSILSTVVCYGSGQIKTVFKKCFIYLVIFFFYVSDASCARDCNSSATCDPQESKFKVLLEKCFDPQ